MVNTFTGKTFQQRRRHYLLTVRLPGPLMLIVLVAFVAAAALL